jgi:hypothetical protein
MDLNAERASFIKELQKVQDISLLKAIKAVLHYSLQNEGRISIEAYNKEMDEAESEFETGNFISHEDVKQQMQSW